MSAVGADQAWAIFALPPGTRDLGCKELWERSLARSRRRRAEAAANRIELKPRRIVPAALAAATLIAPTTQVAFAQATTTAVTTSSTLHKGSRGPAVAAAQRALGITADGVFGPQTKRAVKAFQRAHGLVADGIVGPLTSAALSGGGGSGTSSRSGHASIYHGLPASTTIALQRALGVAADGEYGPQTKAAVRAYQGAHGLTVDGIAGAQTLGALGISGSAAPQPTSAPVASGHASAAVAAARAKIGLPYVSAGVGPSGFDCSGLTQWAMRQAGISIPRTSFAQYAVGTPVSRSAIQPGDLVFFNTNGGGASHVGIATSSSTAISATTHGVMEHSITDSYWGAHYLGARRV
jgi:cell wall-associated NlpC family hydrolase